RGDARGTRRRAQPLCGAARRHDRAAREPALRRGFRGRARRGSGARAPDSRRQEPAREPALRGRARAARDARAARRRAARGRRAAVARRRARPHRSGAARRTRPAARGRGRRESGDRADLLARALPRRARRARRRIALTVDPPRPGDAATREARRRGDPHARVTLLRHGEPDWVPTGGASVPDPGLTPYGRAQARAAAARTAPAGGGAIYVSRSRRGRETAEPLARATGIAPVTLPGLAEIGVNVGGLSQDAVDRYFTEASQRPLAQHWSGWPGAEAFRDFHA